MNPAQRALLDPRLDASRLEEDVDADALLVGAVDLHVHPGPSPFPRRISIRDAAVDAAGAGFRAIAVKSHHLSMQSDVLALRAAGQLDMATTVHAGIALNDTVGGINPWAVELILQLGGRIVWLPTISSPAHIEHHSHGSSDFPVSAMPLRDSTPLSAFADGRPSDSVIDVLDLVAQHRAILNFGHLPAREIDALVPLAVERGVDRMVVSHPEFIVGAGPDDVARWSRSGVHVEHVLGMMLSPIATTDPLTALRRFSDVDTARTIFSSDEGQQSMPLPVTSFRRLVRVLLDDGRPEGEIRAMVGDNAAALLDR